MPKIYRETTRRAKVLEVAPMVAKEREKWVFEMSTRHSNRLVRKYFTGAREHKSDLGTVSLTRLFDELEAEHYDALAYIAEMRRRVLR